MKINSTITKIRYKGAKLMGLDVATSNLVPKDPDTNTVPGNSINTVN